jgi:DNA repair exonuclease SbcCD ATPase subunit
VLERVGLPDIILSVVDASLLAVDKATGNYRQQNHDFPSEVLGIPIVGQTIEILSSVRDLLDSAAGIPRDDEAIPMLQDQLENDLWRPIIAEYNGVMNEFGKHEKAFERLANATETQALRSVVFEDVVPRIETIAEEFGNNKKDMREFIMEDLGIDKSQTQLVKDINKIIDFQIGKISREDLEKSLTSTKVIVPEVQQVINGAEVRARVALDNVYSSQTLITALEGSIQSKKDEIAELNRKIDDEYRFAEMGDPFGGFGIAFGGMPKASQRAIDGWRAEIQAKEREIQDLKDNEIPKITNQLEEMYADFENALDEAQALGIDLSFLEKSKNWDKALADIEDDTMFWESVMPGGLFF